MKLRQLPSGSWTTQVQVDGRRKSITHKSKSECRRLAMEYALARTDAPSATLGTLIDNYIDSKRNVLSPSTVERYERIRADYFQHLMDIPSKKITSDLVQKAVNSMAAEYAPKTVRSAYGLISSTLKTHGMTLAVTLPKKKIIEYHLPIEEQVWLMIDEATENTKTAIMLAAFCSLRRSEICALEASDIKGNMIHVHRAAVYGSGNKLKYKEIPKTSASDRYIQAPDLVIEQIKDKTGRVCPITPSAITANFIRLRNRLGLSCRFHDLRHFYASLQHSLGIRDQYIQKSGGWRSDAVLKMIYRNTLDDVEKTAADLFNSHVNLRGNANEMQTEPENKA